MFVGFSRSTLQLYDEDLHWVGFDPRTGNETTKDGSIGKLNERCLSCHVFRDEFVVGCLEECRLYGCLLTEQLELDRSCEVFLEVPFRIRDLSLSKDGALAIIWFQDAAHGAVIVSLVKAKSLDGTRHELQMHLIRSLSKDYMVDPAEGSFQFSRFGSRDILYVSKGFDVGVIKLSRSEVVQQVFSTSTKGNGNADPPIYGSWNDMEDRVAILTKKMVLVYCRASDMWLSSPIVDGEEYVFCAWHPSNHVLAAVSSKKVTLFDSSLQIVAEIGGLVMDKRRVLGAVFSDVSMVLLTNFGPMKVLLPRNLGPWRSILSMHLLDLNKMVNFVLYGILDRQDKFDACRMVLRELSKDMNDVTLHYERLLLQEMRKIKTTPTLEACERRYCMHRVRLGQLELAYQFAYSLVTNEQKASLQSVVYMFDQIVTWAGTFGQSDTIAPLARAMAQRLRQTDENEELFDDAAVSPDELGQLLEQVPSTFDVEMDEIWARWRETLEEDISKASSEEEEEYEGLRLGMWLECRGKIAQAMQVYEYYGLHRHLQRLRKLQQEKTINTSKRGVRLIF